MTQPFRPRLIDISPINLCATLPEALSKPDHDKHRSVTCQRDGSNGDKRVPLPLRLDPRRDAIIDRKAQRIPDQDDGRDELAREVAVRARSILYRGGETERARDREDGLCEDEAEPMDFVGCAEAPEEHGEGDADQGGEEEPEDVFGLCYSFVAACETENEARAGESYPEGSGNVSWEIYRNLLLKTYPRTIPTTAPK
jgi:hypothetical protein